MKKNLIIISACTLAFFFLSPAYSADGPYVGGNIGLAIVSDSDLTDSTIPGITIDIEYDAGIALAGALGYGFGNIKVTGTATDATSGFQEMIDTNWNTVNDSVAIGSASTSRNGIMVNKAGITFFSCNLRNQV